MREVRNQESEKSIRSTSKVFQDLIVWQKGHQLVPDIYKMTQSFPKEELFGITSQIRRSAVSVCANIAEGFRRKGKADKIRFLNIAQGSLEETRYYLILIKDLNYSDTQDHFNKLVEVSKLLDSYLKKIK